MTSASTSGGASNYIHPSPHLSISHKILTAHGFDFQLYSVTTLDGYLLSMCRIRPQNRSSNKVLYLQHGLLDSPSAFFSRENIEDPTLTIVQRALNEGYEVFMGNLRGSSDTLRQQGWETPEESATEETEMHTFLKVSDREFWNFNIFDHTLDLLAFLSLIKRIKHLELRTDTRIVALGHSLGGTALILYALLMRALNQPHYIHGLVLLSPAGVHKTIALFPRLLLNILYFFYPLGTPSRFPSANTHLQYLAATALEDFKESFGGRKTLAMLSEIFIGDASFIRRQGFHSYPLGGTSNQVIRHGTSSFFHSGELRSFDYHEENEKRYKSINPPPFIPDYHLLDLRIDVLGGTRDTLIPCENLSMHVEAMNSATRILYKNPIATLHIIENAGHLDFTMQSQGLLDRTFDLIEKQFGEPKRESHRFQKFSNINDCRRVYPWIGGFTKLGVTIDALSKLYP